MAIARPSSPKNSKVTAEKASSSGKPKRPLSAYNLFFQLERERLLNGTDDQKLPVTPEDVLRISVEHKAKGKRPHRKSHGKISFLDLARTIADRWKTVNPNVKKVCDGQAVLEKEEYEEKMREWLAKEKESGNVSASDENDSDNECETSTASTKVEAPSSSYGTGVVDPLAACSMRQQSLTITVPNPISVVSDVDMQHTYMPTAVHSAPAPVSPVPEEFNAPEGIESDADFTELRILRQFGLDSFQEDTEPILFYSLLE